MLPHTDARAAPPAPPVVLDVLCERWPRPVVLDVLCERWPRPVVLGYGRRDMGSAS